MTQHLRGILALVFVVLIWGLALTSSNRNAFICGLNVLAPPPASISCGWAKR